MKKVINLLTKRKLLIILILFLILIIYLLITGITQGQQSSNILRSQLAPQGKKINLLPTPQNNRNIPIKETVKIYFKDSAKFKQSATNYLTSVYRSTYRSDKYNFLIEEIIKGPTTKEVGLGLVSTFGKDKDAQFISTSSCEGKDFKYTESNGVFTVTFCRGISLAGTLSGFVLEDQIVKTLAQFDSINKVIVLNTQGNCFNNASGQNLCKK